MANLMKRRPFQGTWTVIRFNWHLHLLAFLAMIMCGVMAVFLTGYFFLAAAAFTIATGLALFLSSFATWLAYDASNLYRLEWLVGLIGHSNHGVNFHAGFDETTALLRAVYPETEWKIFDFYDPEKHTEISIRRARKIYPPSSETLPIKTENIPLSDGTIDVAILFLAAHEIRNHKERVAFFCELRRVLVKSGKIIVTEHIRDLANIGAYSFGAWHFHTRSEWLATFRDAGFRVDRELRNNLFIRTFLLSSNENLR